MSARLRRPLVAFGASAISVAGAVLEDWSVDVPICPTVVIASECEPHGMGRRFQPRQTQIWVARYRPAPGGRVGRPEARRVTGTLRNYIPRLNIPVRLSSRIE